MDGAAPAEKGGDLLSLPATIVETLACHDTFGRLGFSRDDIYVQLSPVANPEHALLSEGLGYGELTLFVVLKAQDLEYSIGVGAIAEEGFEAVWAAAIVAWNDASDAARWAVWERSRIKQRVTELLVHLVQRGFRLPVSDRKLLS